MAARGGVAASAPALKFKVLMLGDSAVGKSCLMDRLIAGDKADMRKQSTMGFDMATYQLPAGGRQVKLQIWDTAGQERFRSLAQNYYRGAQGVMVVFDLCVKASFLNVTRWLSDLSKTAHTCDVVLVGNKADLEDSREVTKEMGQALARELGIPYRETSAMTGAGVADAYQALTQLMVDRLEGSDAGAAGAAAGGAGKTTSAAAKAVGAEAKRPPPPVWADGIAKVDVVSLADKKPAAAGAAAAGGGCCAGGASTA